VSEPSPAQLRALEAVVRLGRPEVAAAELMLSPHTVHTHVKAARDRLGARSTAQAYREALRRGLLPAP
jgi:DNA-binding CsgD family transcriptional regulator